EIQRVLLALDLHLEQLTLDRVQLLREGLRRRRDLLFGLGSLDPARPLDRLRPRCSDLVDVLIEIVVLVLDALQQVELRLEILWRCRQPWILDDPDRRRLRDAFRIDSYLVIAGDHPGTGPTGLVTALRRDFRRRRQTQIPDEAVESLLRRYVG